MVFNSAQALNPSHPISLPCGYCIGCRIRRSEEWAIRLLHESEMHSQNCFLTLTFSDEHLPVNYSVSKRDTQLFMKRLRKAIAPKKVRFFAVGEYGDLELRPHYHLLIFGHDWPDKEHFSTCEHTGQKLYRSAQLEALWTFGYSASGSVTWQSAGYCARYVLKKITGDRADDHYCRTHPRNGSVNLVEPEFVTMSTVPGIGFDWFQKFRSDAFPSDFLVVEGKQRPVPRFYQRLLQKEEELRPETSFYRQQNTPLQRVKKVRRLNASKWKADNTPARLCVREFVKKEQLKSLKRNLKDY